MRFILRACALAVAFPIAASAAQASCSVSSDPGSAVRPLNAVSQDDAQLIVSLPIQLKAMRIDYKAATRKAGCSLGPLAAGVPSYELWGEEGRGRQRKAISTTKGAPVALIVPIIDLMKQLTSPGGQSPARVEGYLLATISNKETTGWRFYTGMPDAVTLKRDMAEALSKTAANPIFRTDASGRTSLFLQGK